MDRTEHVERFVGQVPDVVERAHVARHAVGVDATGPERVHRRLQRRRLDVGQDDTGAALAEAPSRGQSDAAGPTRDDGAGAAQLLHGHWCTIQRTVMMIRSLRSLM